MVNELQQRFAVVETLKQQLDRGFAWLRFTPALERGFQVDYFNMGLPYRVLLLLLTLVLLMATTLLDGLLFGSPPQLSRFSQPLQIFVMVPVLLLALIATWRSVWQSFSDSALMLAMSVVVLGVLAQRTVGARYGFDMPLEYTATTIASVFFLGRLLFWHFTPLAIALTLAMIVNEWLFVVPEISDWYRVMVATVMVAISIVGGYSIEYVMRDDWLNRRLLEQLSNQDPLTGLLNRRAFDEMAQRGMRQGLRQRATVGLVVLDVDYFKAYNDAHGHQAGDKCLEDLGRLLRASARRPLDCCGRYGGEEFVLMWFDAEPLEMQRMCEELRAAIEQLRIPHNRSDVGRYVTVSCGLVTVVPDYHTDVEMLFEQADQALYQAKEQGRNRVVARHLRAEEARKLAAERPAQPQGA